MPGPTKQCNTQRIRSARTAATMRGRGQAECTCPAAACPPAAPAGAPLAPAGTPNELSSCNRGPGCSASSERGGCAIKCGLDRGRACCSTSCKQVAGPSCKETCRGAHIVRSSRLDAKIRTYYRYCCGSEMLKWELRWPLRGMLTSSGESASSPVICMQSETAGGLSTVRRSSAGPTASCIVSDDARRRAGHSKATQAAPTLNRPG